MASMIWLGECRNWKFLSAVFDARCLCCCHYCPYKASYKLKNSSTEIEYRGRKLFPMETHLYVQSHIRMMNFSALLGLNLLGRRSFSLNDDAWKEPELQMKTLYFNVHTQT